MLDTLKKEYTAIKAPSHLKTRVEGTLSRRRFEPKAWSAVAACVALIAVLSVFSFRLLAPQTVSLSYLGETITEQEVTVTGQAQPAVAFGAKTIVPTGIPLSVQAARNTKVSVSGGSIQIFDREGELISVSTDHTLHTPTELSWDVSGLPGGTYTLTLGEQVYEVRIHAENGEMTIYQK